MAAKAVNGYRGSWRSQLALAAISWRRKRIAGALAALMLHQWQWHRNGGLSNNGAGVAAFISQ